MKTMTKEQHDKVLTLLERCCNYESGLCLLLGMPCPQSLSLTRINCRHFLSSVLPADPKLYEEIMKETGGN